jgi:hypothetical protein
MVGGRTLRRQRWPGIVLAVAIGAAMLAPAQVQAATPRVVYTLNVCVALWSAPSLDSTMLANVQSGTALRVTGTNSDGSWYSVKLLDEVTTWVPISAVSPDPPQYPAGTDDSCPFPGTLPDSGVTVDSASGTYALQGAGTITLPTMLRSSPGLGARAVADLAPGQRAEVTAWAGDSQGNVWYLAHAGGVLGWLWPYALRFDGPDPATHTVGGQPIWSPVAGKGMWMVNYDLRHMDAASVVQAAKAAGMTHIYLEVATSRDGFYGQRNLNLLLPLAHAAHIAVIAWVYPWLGEGVSTVAEDLLLTRSVLGYRTPSGDHADGLAADIEEITTPPVVYTYGQVVRQMAGPDMLLVATTYNPIARPDYPYPEIAASFNVMAPQDYWHNNTQETFTAQSPRSLLTVSVTAIRAELGGVDYPIEELGQMYDMFNVYDFTPRGNEPSGAEITGDMQAAKDLGCIGVSYFEWAAASPDELDAFATFTW